MYLICVSDRAIREMASSLPFAKEAIVAHIRFENITKKFGPKTILDNMNLEIEDGSFTVMIGPSGCGKTTLLRIIAGIGPQTSGKVFLDGQDISDLAPAKRNVAMVFQNYAIYPTMTVRENIEFGLKNNKVPKEEKSEVFCLVLIFHQLYRVTIVLNISEV